VKVLDRNGVELEVGDRVHDRVRFHGLPGYRATVIAIKWDYGWVVELRGPDDLRAAESFEAHIQPGEEVDTYHCLDLLAQPENREGSR
jgi:hypothetical protein